VAFALCSDTTQRLSGTKGNTVLPNVELITCAKDAYQAAIAVAIPTQPPT